MTLKILYIEDNILNIQLVRKMLKVMNYQLVEAYDGESGYDAAMVQMPDVILLDMHLPDINGLEVLRRIKKHPHLSHIPVIALTADDSSENQQRCLDAGCDSYLVKPCSRPTLLKAIVQFARQH